MDDQTLPTATYELEFEEICKRAGLHVSPFRWGTTKGELHYSHYTLSNTNHYLINTGYYSEEKELYHFTSIDALKSIIQNRNVRLYNLNNLNDPRELTYAGRIIPTDENKIGEAKENVFIMSFFRKEVLKSSKKDEFNMWRLYGDQGKGVIIQFEVHSPPERWNDYHMSTIKYGSNEKSIFNEINTFLDRVNHLEKKLGVDFYKLYCFHKSSLYQHEHEIRLLFDCRENRGFGAAHVRDGEKTLYPIIKSDNKKTEEKGKPVKYFELPLFFGDEFIAPYDSMPVLKISKIFLGYHYLDEFEAEKNEIQEILKQYFEYPIEIERSRLTSDFWGS